MRKKPARGPRGRSEWGAVQALDAKVNRFFKNLEPRPSPVLTPGTVSRPRVNLVTRMKKYHCNKLYSILHSFIPVDLVFL